MGLLSIISTIGGFTKNATKIAEVSYKVKSDNNKIDRSQFYRLAVCIAILNKNNDKYYDERIKIIIKNAKIKEEDFEEKYLRKYSLAEEWNQDKIKNIAKMIFTEKSVISYNKKFSKLTLDKLNMLYLNDILILNSLIVEVKPGESGKDIFSKIYGNNNSVNKEKDIAELNNKKYKKSEKKINDILSDMEKDACLDQFKIKVIIEEVEKLPNERCFKKGQIEAYSKLFVLIQTKSTPKDDDNKLKSKETLQEELISSYLNKLNSYNRPRYFITLVYNTLFSSLGCYSCDKILKQVFVDKIVYKNYYQNINSERLSIIEKIFCKFEEKIEAAKEEKTKLKWEENFIFWKKTVPVEIIAKMF